MTNQIGNLIDAGTNLVGTGDTMTIGELDLVGGGADPNYHECVLGSTAGGPPGLYPWYIACREK